MPHKIADVYKDNLAKLAHAHPPAFRFLTRLEAEGEALGLRLSTATNAHLYKNKAYLMRCELKSPHGKAGCVVLSPKPHITIERDAEDRSDLMFPRALRDLVMHHSGFKSGWARQIAGSDLELSPSTPDTFFEALFGALSGLEVAT